MTQPKTFEEKIAKLEEIVKALDSNEVTLEESLELYQTGVKLTKECQSILKNAELRVEELHREDNIDED